MPNRRGRRGAKAERPSSCSSVGTLSECRGTGGRGFPAVAIFDLPFHGSDYTRMVELQDLRCDILPSKQGGHRTYQIWNWDRKEITKQWAGNGSRWEPGSEAGGQKTDP